MTLRPVSTIDTDVLVVGGGVTGCATAYYLAREGIETVLVDRGDVNAEGSGANAGSLHTMLVSRFFRSEDPLWVRGREILIPMLREAVEVWRELRTELDTDIEMKLDGGLMVAETEAELRLLERKAAVERRCGLDAHVVTGADLSKLAPYVSDRVVGAEFCRQEGKVNPLLATPALARSAGAAGARMLLQTTVESIDAENPGFAVRTNRGPMRCRRLVNAAGASAARVAAMVGLELPLRSYARHMNVTETAPPLFNHLVQHAAHLLTMKQASAGNIVIGGGWPAGHDSSPRFGTVLRRSIAGNMSVAVAVAPGVSGLGLLRTWTGVIFLAPDGNAIIGQSTRVPGFFHAVPPNAGYTGGPLSGRIVAELMTDRDAARRYGCLTVDRFEGDAE